MWRLLGHLQLNAQRMVPLNGKVATLGNLLEITASLFTKAIEVLQGLNCTGSQWDVDDGTLKVLLLHQNKIKFLFVLTCISSR